MNYGKQWQGCDLDFENTNIIPFGNGLKSFAVKYNRVRVLRDLQTTYSNSLFYSCAKALFTRPCSEE